MPVYDAFPIYTKAILMSIDDFIKLHDFVLEGGGFYSRFSPFCG